MLAGILAVGTDKGVVAEVRTFTDPDQDGHYYFRAASIRPFGETFIGGARVAMGDFDGDNNDELVVASGPGTASRVLIYDLHSDGTVGAVIDDFSPFPGFTGGLFISAGDVNGGAFGDEYDELFVTPDVGGAGILISYSDTDRDGKVSDNIIDNSVTLVSGFYGGLRTATGDIDNSGSDELIVARGPGGGPTVTIFNDTDRDGSLVDAGGSESQSFLAYAGFNGGLYVAAGPIEFMHGNGDEIITAPGAGGGPHVKIFTDLDSDGYPDDVFDEVFAYGMFTGGVRVAAGDAEPGVAEEVITAPGPTGGPHIKIFGDNADAGSLILDNPPVDQFFAYPATVTTGTFIAFGSVDRAIATLQLGVLGSAPLADNATTVMPVFVPQGVSVIGSLWVGLSIAHTYNADLDITLTHVPSGRSVTLFTDVGGNGDGFMLMLSDFASTDIGTVAGVDGQTLTGAYRPESTQLAIFNGVDASGLWTLSITDDAPNDVGKLFGWSLYFAV